MKVYVVTTGEYSDYSIWGIFDNENSAKKWVEILNKDKYVEADYFETNILGAEWKREEVFVRSTQVDAEGGVSWEGVSSYLPRPTEDPDLGLKVQDMRNRYTYVGYRYLEKDREMALKVHADAVAKLRAERIGL